MLAHAREGSFGDINVSDNDARNVMGRLGLGEDKPLRLIAELSGGEKARVALSMFALKASNLLMLDEPSNHLDIECIEALGDSLSSWGGKDGAIVVISHDRAFCEQVGFTHVGTVKDGALTLEERGLRKSDWDLYDLNGLDDADPAGGVGEVLELSPEEKAEQDRKRRLAFNAPKRIEKIETLIEKKEAKIAEYDAEMFENGSDLGLLTDLTEKKTKEEENVMELMAEWEMLEEVMMEFA